MARPTKQGIDFFSMDVHDDDKLDLFIAETGAEGYGILIMLWKLIYRGHGYYIEDNEDLVLLLRKRTFSTPETIETVIKVALKRGIFSEKLHSEHKILTSTGIQKRFFPAARKKKEVHARADFLLISVSDHKNIVSDSGNPIPGGGNATKEKEKEKEKVKEEREYSGSLVSSARAREADFPSLSDVVEFFSDAGFTVYQAEQFHAHLTRGDPPKDWRAAATAWTSENVNKHKRHNGAATRAKKQNGNPHDIANWEFLKACEQRDADAGKIDSCEQDYPGG